ncbi:putative transcription factor WRKY family [Medicago truncatula]|uniref:Putative transcription factor WRKY family n=1 Tax=Medicago truncatula TaxID=3880 RepID=A0A072TU11_MEDTR|nr:probable WRKY transcription factor 65 isoform X2 [Medicago truncatula]KEH20681.1 WRKY family transcription factor [Medicago truncatula]RHN42665.1 putative transcription factor WRKY family [Medicago truncatula]
MKRKFKNPHTHQEEDLTDISQDSTPSSTSFNIDGSVTSHSSSSSKKRRAIQKRVVQIPIKEPHGSRLKGESNTPPSDSWAWRKYGQKPIKGSPYPRAYYRCSSCKGCPARKQVERSRVDPTMLIITYSSDHNHAWPVSKTTTRLSLKKTEPDPVEPDEKFAGHLVLDDELGWLGEIDTNSSAILESPIMAEFDNDMASVFLPMEEEDELLFADLGELPECSTVFRHGLLDARRRLTAPWCGTTT